MPRFAAPACSLVVLTLAVVPGSTLAAPPASPSPAPPRTVAEVLAAALPSDWRAPDPASTLYVELPAGRVVIELAPAFAPRHVDNIRMLARAHWYDGAAIVRAQDNYVVEWTHPEAEAAAPPHALPPGAAPRLAAELDRTTAADLPFAAVPDGDVYAPQAGYSLGFPVGRDPARGRTWLAHCYGMVGVGREDAADSGNGGDIYVVIGHAPRHLDLNVTLVGRVLRGIELLSTLPRGTGPLGAYEHAAQFVPVRSVRLAAEVPEAERTRLQVLRTDTATFAALVQARRSRREAWFLDPVGRIELCNVPVPVREEPLAIR